MGKWFICLLLCLSANPVYGQEQVHDTIAGKGIVVHEINRAKGVLDYFLDIRDKKDNIDTAYVKRLYDRPMISVSLNAAGTSLDFNGKIDGVDFQTQLQAKNKYSLGVSAYYRGLSVGISMNPFNMFGKNKDMEFSLNSYGDKLGGEVMFHSGNSFRGTLTADTFQIDIPSNMVSQQFIALNGYYAFNGHRFSYAAAFDHTSMQKISCGSLLVGGTLMDIRMHVDYGPDSPEDLHIHTLYVGLGAGYTYNFALPHQWLLNISGLSELVLLTHSRLRTRDTEERFPYSTLPIIFVWKTAVVHHFKNYFIALTATATTASIGNRDRMELRNSKVNGRLSFGFKL